MPPLDDKMFTSLKTNSIGNTVLKYTIYYMFS